MADVLIAGAGPAGSAAALLLARNGFAVTIVERAVFPRMKPCGEYLSAGAVRLLHDLGVARKLQSQALEIEGLRLYGNGANAELRFTSAAWSLSRATLDDVLLQSARSAGATLVHARVENVETAEDCVTFSFRDAAGELVKERARFAIAADGSQSLAARKCGLSEPVSERRFALGGHFRDFSGLERFIEMFVDANSYFAVNPLGPDRANVMLVVPECELAVRRNDVDGFLRERANALSASNLFAHARIEGQRIAIGPLAHATRAISAGNLLLAGDAAGCVDPFTGQGVYLALLSAHAAAQAVGTALNRASEKQAAWQEYQTSLAREISGRQRLSKVVRRLVRSPFLARRAARNIGRDPRRAANLIEAISGGPVEPALRATAFARLIA